MSTMFLVDTNVLVYGYDRSEPEKQRRAIEVFEHLSRSGAGVVSTQVLAELYVALQRIVAPLEPDDAVAQVEGVAQAWSAVPVDTDTVLEAMRGARRYQLHYFDAQIWATARLNHIPIILTEDLQDGFDAEGVVVLNPFFDTFDMEALRP
ncbi:MAG: PIN domain-containing protein [Actinomycetota bacterium]|nr:PIN domain-containing protein [Actinomycetota bacterium]